MEKKLTKGTDSQIAGVCSGIAEYFNIDVSFVRVICILLCLFCYPAIIVYVVLAITLPDKNGSSSILDKGLKEWDIDGDDDEDEDNEDDDIDENYDSDYDGYDDEDLLGDEYDSLDRQIENSFEKTRRRKSNNPFEM